MDQESRPNKRFHVLASDLDGTLIPLADNPQNRQDLSRLADLIREHDLTLTFVTGRHLASVEQAQSEYALPRPDWIICDVGTSIYHVDKDGQPVRVEDYARHLQGLIADFPLPQLQELFSDLAGLRLQEQEKQGQFKLSYYADADELDELVHELEARIERRQAPYSLISSVDPFNGDGLIDLLPKGVSKAHAVTWWSDYAGYEREAVVFAGDSGNDTAALTAGYRAIVVGNADRKVARNVYDIHRDNGWKNRLYLANETATSGLLAGCFWFELFPRPAEIRVDLPWGAAPVSVNRTHFRVWAPKRNSVEVEVRRGERIGHQPLDAEGDGHFSGVIEGVEPGDWYRYRLDGDLSRPDPVSRFQPEGVHGPSQVLDPKGFAWTDQNWEGVPKRDLAIYEMHVGAFTKDGTFRSAIGRLNELKELGVTAIELLPVAQTPGRWNWGYDGVILFAPRNTFGTPEDLKAFVDACHAEGLAVILDVVYNHVGPEGNYWSDFAPYYSDKYHTPWGDAFAFDGPDAEQVRRFIIENALYWLREYHLDGLRLDAVHCMYDDSKPHILVDIEKAVAAFRRRVKRRLHLIAEANIYNPEILPSEPGVPGYDAIWCDDIMHSIYSVISPETKVTHREYEGPADLAESLEHGFNYQGMPQQRMTAELRRDERRNPALRESFVTALQNHDNVGNHPHGKRVHQLTSPAHQKAAAALVLLYPSIPLIFMGEESASSAPFRFFVDFEDEHLRKAVEEGRAKEYPDQVWEGAVSPIDERAFRESILSGSDDPTMFAWYQSLLAIRREWIKQGVLSAERIRTFWEPDASLFGFRYSNANGNDAFVISRLFPVQESPKPVSLEIEAEVRLDSESNESKRESKGFELQSVRAIVGRGEFRIFWRPNR